MGVRKPRSGSTETSRAVTAPDDTTGGTPFLKASQLRKKLTSVKILDVRDGNSDFGPGWNLDLKIGKKTFTLTIKENSGNHRRLWSRFKSRWVGKTVNLTVKQYMKQDYVAIADQETATI